MSLLSAAGELDDKGRLAGPRFTGDEAHLPLAGESPVEESPELGQFLFPSDNTCPSSRQSGGKWGQVPISAAAVCRERSGTRALRRRDLRAGLLAQDFCPELHELEPELEVSRVQLYAGRTVSTTVQGEAPVAPGQCRAHGDPTRSVEA